MNRSGSTHLNHRGFTLLEVLITVSIIVILIAAVFAVGQQVITRQKINQTNGVLSSLDRALEEYRIESRVLPRLDTDDYLDQLWRDHAGGTSPVMNDATGQTFLGMVDNYRDEDFAWLPNAAYFIYLSEGYENIDSIIAGIPGSFSRTVQVSNGVFRTQVLDAWDNPIIFVTPDNPLAQAIFGECPSDRPYFMSAGPDGHYGVPTDVPAVGLTGPELTRKVNELREDNIYSVTPGSNDASFDYGILSTGLGDWE
ncbi:MAG: type II secretion system protein [Phycisphaerales bacterium JB065]